MILKRADRGRHLDQSPEDGFTRSAPDPGARGGRTLGRLNTPDAVPPRLDDHKTPAQIFPLMLV